MTTPTNANTEMREFEAWYTRQYMGMLVGIQGKWRESNHYYEAKIAWQAALAASQWRDMGEDKLVCLLAEIGEIANCIRARNGAPEGFSHEYFDDLVERIRIAVGGDILKAVWKCNAVLTAAPTKEDV